MKVKRDLRKIFWKAGYDISRLETSSNPFAQRKYLLDIYNIDTVLDIGANSGQFARELRDDIGYTKRILSFEPQFSAFEVLKANAIGDPSWEVFNFALGDTEERRELNIAGNSYSSSLLDMLPAHLKSAPESEYVDVDIVDVKSVDKIYENLCKATNNVYMKIDTQGFEGRVLRGAEKSLMKIDVVQMEMALVPLYDGELLFSELCMVMNNKGYSLIALQPGFSDRDSGQLLQVDGIFHRQ